MYIPIYVCVHSYIYIYVYMYVYIRICMYMYIYLHLLLIAPTVRDSHFVSQFTTATQSSELTFT